MTKKRSIKRNKQFTSNAHPTKNILQTNKLASYGSSFGTSSNENKTIDTGDIGEIKSILDIEGQPSTSSALTSDNLNTGPLYDELDSFRQRWKREVDETKQSLIIENVNRKDSLTIDSKNPRNTDVKKNELAKSNSSDKIYAKAKELFLKAADMESNEMHLESIRYYKEAMHLCPDIENLIFKEQCMASVKENAKFLMERERNKQSNETEKEAEHQDKIPILDQIRESYYESNKNRDSYKICRPSHKSKGTHISDLPQELIRKLLFYVVGEELDLASLECIAMTCRGFYLQARDQLLWKSICFQTWGSAIKLMTEDDKENHTTSSLDWRQVYIDRPRVNFDGVYISRTRYIRQGDIGFQDLTYRPFHIVRYYRYLRFFPDGRVLILTTNEEPDKIVPIFRHAMDSKQFSSDLSILEGTFEFIGANQIHVMAEKDCTITSHQRRQPQYYARQTPISQKLNLKFELKTLSSKPFKNNVLKWLEYTLLTRLETEQELDSFDLTYDMFPNLIFSRVKRFNVKSSKALINCW